MAEFTQEELHSAFDQVQSADWRDPIDKVVKEDHFQIGWYDLMVEAIIHFTGTVPTVIQQHCQCCYRFTAVGYRNGPCGDH